MGSGKTTGGRTPARPPGRARPGGVRGPVASVGYMGGGKTTVGRMLARALGWDFVDLDREISRRSGLAIPEIFETSGEDHFRDLEHRALLATLGGERERVVAC